ncbi:hypothetical protein J43TS9_01610 [Paenibacillus cineris]|nr:hypothetical protein J43TS9_01610 [Paenibacillus cineris]
MLIDLYSSGVKESILNPVPLFFVLAGITGTSYSSFLFIICHLQESYVCQAEAGSKQRQAAGR